MAPTLTAVPPSTPPTSLHRRRSPAPGGLGGRGAFPRGDASGFEDDIDGFVDRNRYYIEATLTFEDAIAMIRGAERVRYTNRSADVLNEIVFRLYPNLSALGGRMGVYQAALNDQPVSRS